MDAIIIDQIDTPSPLKSEASFFNAHVKYPVLSKLETVNILPLS